jgi:hypothetical protein
MRRFGARRDTLPHAPSTSYIAHRGSIAPDQCESRYEPRNFGTPTLPSDPYAVWAAQREAEREREDHEQVRWVFRPRTPGGQEIRARSGADQGGAERRDRRERSSTAPLTRA